MNINAGATNIHAEEIAASINKAGLADEVFLILKLKLKIQKNGDYVTNIADGAMTKIAKRNPREIAQAIVDNLDTEKAHIKTNQHTKCRFIIIFIR